MRFEICLDERRVKDRLCIVQSAKDIFIIEESKQFDGIYFVIEELELHVLEKLMIFIKQNIVKDILFAITPSLSSDAFILFIEDKLNHFDINFTKIVMLNIIYINRIKRTK